MFMRTIRDNACKFFRLLAKRQSGYPEEIQIEVTNLCNMTCAMCPRGDGSIPQNDFPIETFEALVKQNPAPKRLVLTGWGEPLLHDRFFDLVQLTNDRWPKTRVRFTTNGILLDTERRGHISGHRISGITLSADLWPERDSPPVGMEKNLHPPSKKIVRNMSEYCLDKNLAAQTPLIVQCLVMKENVEDIKRFIDFASEHPIEAINLVRLQVEPGQTAERPSWREEQSLIADAIRYGKEHGVPVRSVNRQHIALRLATHFDRVCMRTDDSVYITTDGVITPCCNLREYAIGTIHRETPSIAEAWRSTQERQFFRRQQSVCGSCDALFHHYRD